MKLSQEKPPNIKDILEVFPNVLNNPDLTPVFCYGDTLYNAPDDLRRDIIFHEEVHSKQQGSTPDIWWAKYLYDKDFRLSQEIEAYGEQYKVINKLDIPRKVKSTALDEMTRSLSSDLYGKIIGYGEAKSKIRNYARLIS